MIRKRHQVYLPLVETIRQWSDRKKKVELPLFPSYVFARISEAERFSVLNSNGVVRFVSFSGEPARIPDKDLQSVRRLLETCPEVTAEQYLKNGDRVRVIVGPLRDLEGFVLDTRRSKKLVIQIDAIRQAVAVEIPPGYVEKIDV